MSEFVKPYNNDPFVGNLSTPVTTSTATKLYLGNLPIYRKGLSPLLRGLEIGMAHGYFLIGPFYILGPLRNSPNALLVGLFSAFGLILILTLGLTIYGLASFQGTEGGENLEKSVKINMFNQLLNLGKLLFILVNVFLFFLLNQGLEIFYFQT
mgnify:CR=1 FL=1